MRPWTGRRSATTCREGDVDESGYAVRITNRAAKELKKSVAHQDKDRVKETIDALGEDPRPPGCVKVKGVADTFRVRIGPYRVVYRVRDDARAVIVARIARRSEDTYKNL